MEMLSTKSISLSQILHPLMFPLLRWWNNLVVYLQMSWTFKVHPYLIWIILCF